MKSNGGDGKEELRGQESLYRGEFGEQMVGKSTPVIVQLYLEDYDLKGIISSLRQWPDSRNSPSSEIFNP